MTDTHKAVPDQAAVYVDERNETVDLRQVDQHGSEHCISIHRDLLPRLIQALTHALKGG